MSKKLFIFGLLAVCLLFTVGVSFVVADSPMSIYGLAALPFMIGAVTTQSSTQYGNQDAVPIVHNAPYDENAKVRFFYFSHTQSGAGDANSLVNFVRLPAGNFRLCKSLCRVNFTAFGASRVLDVGYLTYVNQAGVVVAAAIDTIADGIDVSGAGTSLMGVGTNALTDDDTLPFDARGKVSIQAKVLGGTIPDAATLKGYIAIIKE